MTTIRRLPLPLRVLMLLHSTNSGQMIEISMSLLVMMMMMMMMNDDVAASEVGASDGADDRSRLSAAFPYVLLPRAQRGRLRRSCTDSQQKRYTVP